MPSGRELTDVVTESDAGEGDERAAERPAPMLAATNEREPVLCRVGWAATVVAAALVPLLFLPLGTNVFFLPKLTLLWVCTILGLVGVVTAWRAGAELPKPPAVVVPVAALLVIVVVATAFSTRPWVSLLGRYARHGGLVSLVSYVAFATVVFVSCWRRLDRLRWLLRAVGIGGVVGALYVLLQVVGLDFDWSSTIGAQSVGRYMGALGNSNFAGAHLAIVLPILVVLRATEEGRRVRLGIALAIPVVVLALWLTGSRGAWIAAVVGVSVTLLIDPRFAPRWLTILFTALAVLGIATVVAAVVTRTDEVRGQEAQSILRRQTLEQRADMWAVAIELTRDHPVLGTGPDTFAQELLPYADDVPDLTRRPESLDAPHNILLAHAIGAGVPGASAWLAVVIVVWVVALRRRNRLDPDRRTMLTASGGAFAAYLAQGMVSIDVVPLAFLGWLLMAAMTSASVVPDEADEPEPFCRPVGRMFTSASIAVAAFLIAACLLPIVGDVRTQRALDAAPGRRAADPNAYVSSFENAISTSPKEPRLWLEASRQAQADSDRISDTPARRQLLHAALGFVDRALEIEPGEVDAAWLKARAFERLGGLGEPGAFEAADEVYLAHQAVDPYDPQMRLERARFLLAWNKTSARPDLLTSAHAELDAIAQMRHSWVDGLVASARLYTDLGDHDAAVASVRRALALDPEDQRAQKLLSDLGG